MPELPDVVVYVERIAAKFAGQRLLRLRLASPFLVRTFNPPLASLNGKRLQGCERLGKRLVFVFEDESFLVLHLMISGRLRLKPLGAVLPRKVGLAAFDFENASLMLTEASSQKRASLHLVCQRSDLEQFDRGGLEPLSATLNEFKLRMRLENRTLKRALTDPRLVSGIGNAYSDEILHAAKLSPVKRTRALTDLELKRLHTAMRRTLKLWTTRLRRQTGDEFPDKVTAFHEGMAVHGRYGQPCPICGTKVQRIRYASNEVNYCTRCQTDGKLLADRGLSRLLKEDWPKLLEELEELVVSKHRS
jgi:formamidopyrimidine-DNA glycosylase